MLLSSSAIAIATMLLGTILAAWRLEFGPNPLRMRLVFIVQVALCAGCLVLEWFTWHDSFSLLVLGLIGLGQAVGVYSRYFLKWKIQSR